MDAHTQTPCLSNNIAFSANYDSQMYTKQKLFVNPVSDYDFGTIDKEEKSLSSCQSLNDVGYVFDEHGILRQIYSGQPFPFKGLLSPNCKSRYDQFRKLTAKYVRTKLMDRGLLFPTVELGNNGLVMRVLHSRDFYTNRGTLLVLIQAGMVARAGVWCPRLLLYVSGGLYVASQIPYVDNALSNGYSVLIINSNEYLPPRSSANNTFRSPSPEELINAAWQHILPKCPARHIVILAHMYAGTALLQPLQPAPVKCPLNWGLTATNSSGLKFDNMGSWTFPVKKKCSTGADNLFVDPAVAKLMDSDTAPINNYPKASGDSSSSAESLTNSCSQKGSANAGSHRVSPDPDSNAQFEESAPQTGKKRSKNLNPPTIQDSDAVQPNLRNDIAHFRLWETRRLKFWRDLKRRVRAIVFTDSVVNLKMQGIQDEDVLKWFEQHTIHYSASTENVNIRVDHSSFYRDVPTYSAGTQEHDRIPSCVMDCAFSFFDSKIEEYNSNRKQRQTTTTKSKLKNSSKTNENSLNDDMKPGASWM